MRLNREVLKAYERKFKQAIARVLSGKPPVLSDSGHRSPCPDDLTPACYEYMGKATRCFCSSREGLREILEPTKE